MAQTVEIENFWNGVAFYCPACGAEVYSPDGQGAASPCEHLLFSWIDAVGEFENPNPNLSTLIERLTSDDGYEPSPFDDAFLEGLPDNSVLFSMIHHGTACGPVSMTVLHAIQFPENEIA